LNEYMRSKLTGLNLDGIILSANWRNHSHSKYFGLEFSRLLSDLAAFNIPVIVIGPPVEVYHDLPGFLARKHVLGLKMNDQDNVQRNSFETDEALRALALAHGASYVSILDSMCPEKVCDLHADPQTPLVWDQFHLTPEGASKVINAIGAKLLAGLKLK
jgi:lysophospholipase L1-like esterase